MAGLLAAGSATARAQEAMTKPPNSIPAGETFAVIPLSPMTSANEANDLQTALRNTVSRARIYYEFTQRALVFRGTDADLAVARKMVEELNKPQQGYRLTYTITVKNGGKTVNTRHIELALGASGKAEVKQGNRIPIVTGTSDAKSGANTQVQYLDVGLMISAEMDGERLRSKVEETRLSENKSSVGAEDPVVEQTELNGESPLVLGKPLVLGTLDVPANATTGARQEVVEVTAEPVE
ncbi:MAG: hypothetical protein WBD67_13600 [Terracidiphilus sp.]